MGLLVGITGKGILVKKRKETKDRGEEKKKRKTENFSPETQP